MDWELGEGSEWEKSASAKAPDEEVSDAGDWAGNADKHMSTAGWGVCVLDHRSLQRSAMTGLHAMSGVRRTVSFQEACQLKTCGTYGLQDHA